MAYIDAHRREVVDGCQVGVEPICAVLKDAGVQIAPSSYYAAKSRPLSVRAVRDVELTELIGQVHRENLGVYGAQKVDAPGRQRGLLHGRATHAGPGPAGHSAREDAQDHHG